MNFEFPYGTFANYSPSGANQYSRISQSTCGAIKSGKVNIIQSIFKYLDPIDYPTNSKILLPFLNDNVTFVPVPRSSPITNNDLWPARVIADEFVNHGYGNEVEPLISRISPIRKSSLSGNNRPSYQEHMDTLKVSRVLFEPEIITLVDDVLSLGSTTGACALLLKKVFPNAQIKIFAIFRTRSFETEISILIQPSTGKVHVYGKTGRTWREDFN